MKIIEIETKREFDFQFSKSSGEEDNTCPMCSHTRKPANQKVKCFRWNHDKETGFCHNCQSRFGVLKDFKPRKDYSIPEWKNNTELSDKVVKWFEGRGISQFTLRQMKVSEGMEYMPQDKKLMNTIQFNYFRDGDLVNIKYRTGSKHFKLYKDAELILYNLGSIKDTDSVVIVEGEMDCLSFYEAGVRNVVSVPNGASVGRNNLQYLDNCIDYFENKTEIILATDGDQPGVNLRNELAARLGVEKCFKVNFKDCKDANEYLQKYGKEELVGVLGNKEPYPITGIFRTIDLIDDLKLLYLKGLQKGLTIDEPIDDFLSFELGRLYTVTGVPGHGKSEWVDYWLSKLNIIHGLKVGYFSPENFPLQLHQSKLISKLTGAEFSQKGMSLYDFDDAVDYMGDTFFWVMPEEDFTVERILEKARYLVFRKGISIFVIDPYNKLEHSFNKGESETAYISRFLDLLVNFCHKNNISIILIAHPRKMQKDKSTGNLEVPNLYDINGSANFYNKTDFGMTIYRDFNEDKSIVYVQKAKFKHLGSTGYVEMKYNYTNGRYEDIGKLPHHWDNSNWLRKKQEPQQTMFPNEDFYQMKDEVPF